MNTRRAISALLALALPPVAAYAQEGEVDLASLDPPGPEMRVTLSQGEAARLYPLGTTLPETAWVCLPENGGLLVLVRPSGKQTIVWGGECAGGPVEDAVVAATPDSLAVPVAVPDPDADPVEGRGWSVLAASGPDAARFPPGSGLPSGVKLCLEEGSRVLLDFGVRYVLFSGPGCNPAIPPPPDDSVGSTIYVNRVAAATRGSAPRINYMLVIRGSRTGLAFYPAGSRVRTSGRICLPPNAGYLTFQKEGGGLVTYGDGGCNRAIAEPSPGDDAIGAGNGP
ncbi:hypothetical protein [Parerythrobacter lacustris]|uniref:Uncharacterized protein n=1 Tax=Parerythrobacter lacustris TaxID=2969984 RepID=A0ABT1XMA6_9SPHN|nr:hypothetical protein [Parerythrobacter lacustris]MCR2832379.1 hypothetical protein [Parerythrobacter lacustris]